MTGVVATVLVNTEVTKAQLHSNGKQGSTWKTAGTFQLPNAALWPAILGLLHGPSFSTPHSSVLPLLDSSLQVFSMLTLCSQGFWLLLKPPTLPAPSLQTWDSPSYGVSSPRWARGTYNPTNPKAILIVLLLPTPNKYLLSCFLSLTW